jgi:hypothetical protein
MIVYGGDQHPKCDYTKELCTFCVLGNQQTYKEAKKKEGTNNERN